MCTYIRACVFVRACIGLLSCACALRRWVMVVAGCGGGGGGWQRGESTDVEHLCLAFTLPCLYHSLHSLVRSLIIVKWVPSTHTHTHNCIHAQLLYTRTHTHSYIYIYTHKQAHTPIYTTRTLHRHAHHLCRSSRAWRVCVYLY